LSVARSAAAVEIVYPATLARFENFAPDAQLGFLSLALSEYSGHEGANPLPDNRDRRTMRARALSAQ
jgi:hypothetical protein